MRGLAFFVNRLKRPAELIHAGRMCTEWHTKSKVVTTLMQKESRFTETT
jgi:hypothetical protein